MPKIDFARVEDMRTSDPLPEGTYRCRLAEVEERSTRSGDVLWALRWIVHNNGSHEGRTVFDNLVFSPKGSKRIKLLCGVLGIDVSGVVDLEPSAILDSECCLTVETQEYTDGKGNARKKSAVLFDGYTAVEQLGAMADSDDDGDGKAPF